MRISILLFVLVTFVFFSLTSLAQTEFSLYRLNASLPQSNMINPAFYPNHRVVIGLPVISSIYANIDNDAISFHDIFVNSETDSLRLDTLNLPDKFKARNQIRTNVAIQLFYLGLRLKRSYISVSIHQVFDMRLNYPGDLVGWAIRGPGDARYAGRALDLGNFYSRALDYNKVSINYARDITPKLTVGARFNYLLGVASGETTKISGQLQVGIDSVNINTGELLVQSTGYEFFDSKVQNNFNIQDLWSKDFVDYFIKTKNKGVAWDFGATYQLTKRLTLSAAVDDIGFINWNAPDSSYRVAPVNYTFKGVDILDYISQSAGQRSLNNEIDSLRALFTPVKSPGNPYKTSLTGKFYGGVNFHILGINNFNALIYFDLFQKKITPAISLGYNLQLGRFLNATVGATFKDRKINHVGAGIALKLLNLQIYGATDRANTFAYPARASRADIHMGANLVFGKPKKKDKPDENKDEEPEREEEPEKDEPAKKEPVKDTTKVVPTDTVKLQPPSVEPRERIQETPIQETVIQPTITPPVEEPRHEVVTQGVHKEELPVSHFVVVGSFRLRQNAERYSRAVRARGFQNEFGFVSEKGLYYVTVHRSKDLEETRRIRNEFRTNSEFQFPDSWVLTVQDQ